MDKINALTDRRMAYDGEGIEVGYLTLAEARQQFKAAEYDEESDTITVERGQIRRVKKGSWCPLCGTMHRPGQYGPQGYSCAS